MTLRSFAALLAVAPLLAVACGGSDDGDAFTPATGGSSGAAGSGTAGSGTAGSGTAGSGTAGSGTAGSGTAGSGTAGSGTAGSGTAGSGTAGTTTAGKGGATSGAGGATAGAGGGSPDCTSCLLQSCSDRLAKCMQDPQCSPCLAANPPQQCILRQAFRDVALCSCDKCATACPSTDCGGIQCLDCTAKKCEGQLSDCLKSPTCSMCLQDNPPPQCANNPTVDQLFQCTQQQCPQVCN